MAYPRKQEPLRVTITEHGTIEGTGKGFLTAVASRCSVCKRNHGTRRNEVKDLLRCDRCSLWACLRHFNVELTEDCEHLCVKCHREMMRECLRDDKDARDACTNAKKRKREIYEKEQREGEEDAQMQ